MLHKIREAMEQRDVGYKLAGIVELDDSYFGGPTTGGKRGRGTKKTKVIVGLSINSAGNPEHIKMKVIDDIKSSTVLDFAKRNVKDDSIIKSDGYKSYRKLGLEFDHQPLPYDIIRNPDHLKWIHIVVSNAKALITGTYHGLDGIHLQRYLNEFCYRFNRRMFVGQGFFRLLSACVSCKTITYAELT